MHKDGNKPVKVNLLPCPFCGSKGVYINHECVEPDLKYWVGCASCGTEGPYAWRKYKAINDWNNRSKPDWSNPSAVPLEAKTELLDQVGGRLAQVTPFSDDWECVVIDGKIHHREKIMNKYDYAAALQTELNWVDALQSTDNANGDAITHSNVIIRALRIAKALEEGPSEGVIDAMKEGYNHEMLLHCEGHGSDMEEAYKAMVAEMMREIEK